MIAAELRATTLETAWSRRLSAGRGTRRVAVPEFARIAVAAGSHLVLPAIFLRVRQSVATMLCTKRAGATAAAIAAASAATTTTCAIATAATTSTTTPTSAPRRAVGVIIAALAARTPVRLEGVALARLIGQERARTPVPRRPMTLLWSTAPHETITRLAALLQ